MLDFIRSPKFLYLSVFLVGVVLRGIPELLVSWYPIGYETITWYAPRMMTFYEKSLVDIFANHFVTGLLFYTMMWFVCVASRADVYLILKVVGPILYGCLAFSFFLFLKKGLKFDNGMAFLAAFICILQPATLRISWDRFETITGLIPLFLTLSALRSDFRWKWPLTAILAVVTTLSRELIAAVLLAILMGYMILESRDRKKVLLVFASSFMIFMLMISPYFGFQLIQKNPSTRVIVVQFGQAGPIPVLVNYLSSQSTWMGYAKLLSTVFLLFIFTYLFLIFFVLKGVCRDKVLDPMVAWLLVGSFSLVIIPWMAVPGYERWQMMLVFPFSAYATIGLGRLRLLSVDKLKALTIIVLILTTVGIGYSTGVLSYPTITWVPANLVQSSIDISQIDDSIKCLEWLDGTAVSNSCLITEERFYGWASIHLNDDIRLVLYPAPGTISISMLPDHDLLDLALETAVEHGFTHIYLIWYTDSLPGDFKNVHTQNGISIFQYLMQE